jgi:hypothetical protein
MFVLLCCAVTLHFREFVTDPPTLRLTTRASAPAIVCAVFELRNFQEGFYEKFFSLEPAPGRIVFCIRAAGEAE